MRWWAMDSETHLITDTCKVPRLVCVQSAVGPQPPKIELACDALGTVETALSERIIGANIFFDFAVWVRQWPHLLPKVFQALDEGRVYDTMLGERLIQIYRGAGGKLDLASQLARFDLAPVDKEDPWRLRYAELDGVPVERWPEEAKHYAENDVAYLWALMSKQGQYRIMADMPSLCRAWWALHLMTTWGLKTDPSYVGELEHMYGNVLHEQNPILIDAGILREKGTIDTKALQELVKSAHPDPRYTPTGRVGTSADDLKRIDHPVIEAYRLKKHAGDMLSKYISWLKSPTVHARPRLLETGRVSLSSPPIQTMPRDEPLRPGFIPREGYLYSSIDYDGAELRSLAQACLDIVGWSRLAELYQKDPHADPHTAFAEAVGCTRQEAKAANFGLPGGMGAAKFADTYGCSTDEAWERKNQYLQAWPEMRAYFRHVSEQAEDVGIFRSLRSGRLRSAGYCDGANGYFQGLTSDGARRALYLVVKEAYLDRNSPLWGSRVVNFIHDELLIEHPEEVAPEAADRAAELMVEGMMEYTPDVPSTASPALMRRWYKEAESVRENGRLVVWEPGS